MKIAQLLLLVFVITFLSCGEKEKNTHSHSGKKPNKENTVRTDSTQEKKSVPIEQLERAKELIAATGQSSLANDDAIQLFKMHCASCHGFNGNMEVNGAKNLTKSTITLEESVAQIYFGKGLMTPFRNKLSDEEIVTVARYIESLR